VVRISSKSGTIKGRLPLEPTNGEWQEVACNLTSPITGVQNLFFTFQGSGSSLFDFDSWQFSEEPTGIKSQTTKLKSQTSEVYDLRGRKVASQLKGIKIVDGKKILE